MKKTKKTKFIDSEEKYREINKKLNLEKDRIDRNVEKILLQQEEIFNVENININADSMLPVPYQSHFNSCSPSPSEIADLNIEKLENEEIESKNRELKKLKKEKKFNSEIITDIESKIENMYNFNENENVDQINFTEKNENSNIFKNVNKDDEVDGFTEFPKISDIHPQIPNDINIISEMENLNTKTKTNVLLAQIRLQKDEIEKMNGDLKQQEHLYINEAASRKCAETELEKKDKQLKMIKSQFTKYQNVFNTVEKKIENLEIEIIKYQKENEQLQKNNKNKSQLLSTSEIRLNRSKELNESYKNQIDELKQEIKVIIYLLA
ncbi:hypothetical protein A3Q56_05556 [Intoshia linei]|uniref:Uncharacterized protein n=1 Tax=Intoshia linei TaxID=1819745 RepID=A0A177AXD8_9BILA|nr:hypothetical protein A3Q56_05556 [Intoshia linei]